MEIENQNNQTKKDLLLPASILVAAILIAGSVIYSNGVKNYKPTQQEAKLKQDSQTEEIKITANDVILGNPDAKVTIVEFGDFQCPYCAKFFKETEPLIRKNYVETGKAKMVFKPLAFLGEESINAALAAICAKDQGKFWDFHDALYNAESNEMAKGIQSENNGNLNPDLFKKIASNLKMDVNQFISCFDSKKYENVLSENSQAAETAMNGRVSTPTIFINGQMIQGAQPYGVFQPVIDAFFGQ
ncbi:DsbA family protein [Candidatus Wolfebacteria bacterium]|nr:DsbA family protein [Candidatus Wolfebacteria bacterium]